MQLILPIIEFKIIVNNLTNMVEIMVFLPRIFYFQVLSFGNSFCSDLDYINVVITKKVLLFLK